MARNTIPTIQLKRGNTFRLDISATDPNAENLPVDLTDYVITAQLRYGDELAADLQVILTDVTAGDFSLYLNASLVRELKVRKYDGDILFHTPDGTFISSESFILDLEKEVTRFA